MTRTQRKMHIVTWAVLGPALLAGIVLLAIDSAREQGAERNTEAGVTP